MPVLFRDVETKSTLDLRSVGAWRYAGDPTTEVLCIGYAVDDGPVTSWTPGQPIPEEFREAARDPNWLIVAHNDSFERAIEEQLLAPRYGWPLVPIERHRCTMAMALANALPGALDAAAAALGLAIQKDAAGARLMRQMAKPRKPRKDEDPDAIHWLSDPVHLERLRLYCETDVAVERELYRHLPPLSDAEQQLWQLDALINVRGFHVDVPLAEAAQRIVDQSLAALNAEITELTDGRITSIAQVGKLTALLQEAGHDVKGVTKRSIAAVLAHNPDERIRRILELRRDGGKASAGKLETLLRSVDGGRLHGTLKFHGAATGRWSGSGFQPHNLARAQPSDPDAAIAAVISGDIERVRAIGPPLDVVASLSRSMICAAPGMTLISADYSAIELRVLAWLAGEAWKLDTYRKFDASGDPKFEPYCATASRIFFRPVTPEQEEERQMGKLFDLAFGYGGALGAFRRITDAEFSDTAVDQFKTQWRNAHPAIVRYWGDLHRALLCAVRTKAPVDFKNLHAEMRDGNLYLRLPSGRELVYPQAHIKPGQFSDEIVFMDNALGGWKEARGWHGIFAENVVSGMCRDLLAAAMPKLEAAGYPIVLHVHDEIVAEVPEGFGSADEFARLMTELPPWADGLPLVAKGSRRQRYAKNSKESASPMPSEQSPDLPIPDFLNRTGAPIPPPLAPVMNTLPIASDLTVTPIIDAPTLVPSDTPPVALETLDERLAQIPLPDLIGDSGKINCPFHDDNTPSCYIYPDHYYCFGCGARGNHLDWLRNAEGLSDAAAIEVLLNWHGPVTSPRPEAGAEQKRALALQLWAEAKPIAGTLAVRYLAEVRGIDADALPTDNAALRFHPNCPFGRGLYVPCLLALFRDIATNEPVGIHRIGLLPEVFRGAKVQRRMLGARASPSAVKLWPATDQLFIGEGIETVLAAATHLTHRGRPMRPAWAAGSGDALAKVPFLPGIALTLLVDHDLDGRGAVCANACRQR